MASTVPMPVQSFGRPPRALNVVRDPRPEELGAAIDWSSWYLTDEEDMGEGIEQSEIIDVLRSAMRALAVERQWTRVFVGSDQFFAWLPEEPLVRVSPDVYLLDDPPAPPMPASWQTWRQGHRPPRLAVEIVSGDEPHPERWRKDYEQGPEKYAQLGTQELVIFDPQAALGRAREAQRVALQVYRRAADGVFVRVYVGPGPCASHELSAFLVPVTEGGVARLRVARDPEGRDWVPTAAEARDAAERARD
ncbi:MAG: Uma2 family endonuclease, partial [Myxococcales bacterium]|nr:Uma2 family endonuclease [Myxococcales bacterium]